MSEFRRKLLITQKEVNIFDTAYFYCPYDKTQSTTDVNNGITADYSSGEFNGHSYYTNGNNQCVEYYDVNLRSIITSYNYTVYFEFTPYSVNRNFYLLDIAWSYDGSPWSLLSKTVSFFVYYTNGNKFGATIDALGGYFDNVIPGSPVVIYGNKYKVCIKWTNNSVQFFINGIKYTVSIRHTKLTCAKVVLGRNSTRTDRGSKAEFYKFAIWNNVLSDEECIKMTIG